MNTMKLTAAVVTLVGLGASAVQAQGYYPTVNQNCPNGQCYGGACGNSVNGSYGSYGYSTAHPNGGLLDRIFPNHQQNVTSPYQQNPQWNRQVPGMNRPGMGQSWNQNGIGIHNGQPIPRAREPFGVNSQRDNEFHHLPQNFNQFDRRFENPSQVTRPGTAIPIYWNGGLTNASPYQLY